MIIIIRRKDVHSGAIPFADRQRYDLLLQGAMDTAKRNVPPSGTPLGSSLFAMIREAVARIQFYRRAESSRAIMDDLTKDVPDAKQVINQRTPFGEDVAYPFIDLARTKAANPGLEDQIATRAQTTFDTGHSSNIRAVTNGRIVLEACSRAL